MKNFPGYYFWMVIMGEGFKPMDFFYYPDDPAILFLKGSKQAEYNVIYRNDLSFVFLLNLVACIITKKVAVKLYSSPEWEKGENERYEYKRNCKTYFRPES